MMLARRIGILAGGGTLPREIADSLAARRIPLVIVALEGEADQDFAPHRTETVNWGQIGRMLRVLRAHGTTDMVFVGRVSRPDLRKVRPDSGFYLALPMIWRILRVGGDDAVLREVIRFFEGKGLRVVGPADVAPELLVGPGALGAFAPDDEDRRDIALGLDVVARLGPLDIGQGVVVAGGRVEAIEGAEGTDRMLDRVAAQRRVQRAAIAHAEPTPLPPSGRPFGVLIKRPKPGQELRIDLPAIGPETARRAAEAGLAGVAVLEGRTMAAQRQDLVRCADAMRLFIAGIPDTGADPLTRGAQPLLKASAGQPDLGLTVHAGPAPSRDARLSAGKAARVAAALQPFAAGQAVVVVRRHVLAVEAGEGSLALVDRVADLRQWGVSRKKRLGVVVLRPGSDCGPRVVAAAARAGLEGIVIARRGPAGRPPLLPPAETIGAGTRHGVFVATMDLVAEEGGDG